MDAPKLLDENHAKFRAKWGDQEADRYRAVETPRRMRVALTMIVRDEAHNLPACLGPVRDLFDDIVVVDTGSTDGTPRVAEELGARVVSFPWVDDFSAARNVALEHARGDYAFWIDADDRVDEGNRAKLANLFAGLRDEHAAYVVKCRCVPDRPGGSPTVVDHVRLFRLRADVRWSYRVHEQILPALRRTGADVRWSEATVDHIGYVDPALRRRKLDRDLRLLEMEHAGNPDEPFVLFNLGSVAHELGRYDDAVKYLQRSLARSHPRDSIVRKLYSLIAGCQRELRQPVDAMATVRDGRSHYPDDAELLFLEGRLLQDAGDLAGAEAAFRRLLHDDTGEPAHFASVDAGLRGIRARHALASVLLTAGRPGEAAQEWQRVVADNPAFAAGWAGLGEVGLAVRDGKLVEESAANLRELGATEDAFALRARFLLDSGEYAQARKIVADGLDSHPRSVRLLLLMSYAFLREGVDDAATERSLREVLAVAPDHPEARHNLDVLRQKRAAELVPHGALV